MYCPSVHVHFNVLIHVPHTHVYTLYIYMNVTQTTCARNSVKSPFATVKLVIHFLNIIYACTYMYMYI